MPILVPQAPKALQGKSPKSTPTLMPPTRRGARFGPPPANDAPAPVVEKAKPKREKKPKAKIDPKHVAAARELRDRWLEPVNADPSLLVAQGKYDVAKALASPSGETLAPIPALPAPQAIAA